MCKIAGICGTSFSALLFARQSYIFHILKYYEHWKGAPQTSYLGKKWAGCYQINVLELNCCKKRQKIVPDQLLLCGVGDL